MLAPRFIRQARVSRPNCPRRESVSRVAARGGGAGFCDPKARRRRLHPRRLRRHRDHGRGPSRGAPRSRSRAREILVAGGTSTGKTTLTNALLAEVAKTTDRVVLIEDTRELQCRAPNLVALRTRTVSPRSRTWCDRRCAYGPTAFRSARSVVPRRSICSRPGAQVIPAASAPSTPVRHLARCAGSSSYPGSRRRGPRALIAETIDVIAVLSGRGADRRLATRRVTGLGRRRLHSLE